MWIISETDLFCQKGSLSKMRTPFQSNSCLLFSLWSEITDKEPDVLFMSLKCSFILVLSDLFVCPTRFIVIAINFINHTVTGQCTQLIFSCFFMYFCNELVIKKDKLKLCFLAKFLNLSEMSLTYGTVEKV